MKWSAPNVFASSSFPVPRATAATWNPIFFAYWMPRWPSPPMPWIATKLFSGGPAARIALNTVTPAQSSGAAVIASKPSGTRTNPVDRAYMISA